MTQSLCVPARKFIWRHHPGPRSPAEAQRRGGAEARRRGETAGDRPTVQQSARLSSYSVPGFRLQPLAFRFSSSVRGVGELLQTCDIKGHDEPSGSWHLPHSSAPCGTDCSSQNLDFIGLRGRSDALSKPMARGSESGAGAIRPPGSKTPRPCRRDEEAGRDAVPNPHTKTPGNRRQDPQPITDHGTETPPGREACQGESLGKGPCQKPCQSQTQHNTP